MMIFHMPVRLGRTGRKMVRNPLMSYGAFEAYVAVEKPVD